MLEKSYSVLQKIWKLIINMHKIPRLSLFTYIWIIISKTVVICEAFPIRKLNHLSVKAKFDKLWTLAYRVLFHLLKFWTFNMHWTYMYVIRHAPLKWRLLNIQTLAKLQTDVLCHSKCERSFNAIWQWVWSIGQYLGWIHVNQGDDVVLTACS